jgi:hypothetical protein
MENCTLQKAAAITDIVRAVLDYAVHRETGYVALNIFQEDAHPKRVYYAQSVDSEGFDEFGQVVTDWYLEFTTEEDAAKFSDVLSGILVLGLTRFEARSETFIHHNGYEPDPEVNETEVTAELPKVPTSDIVVTNPTFKWFSRPDLVAA